MVMREHKRRLQKSKVKGSAKVYFMCNLTLGYAATCCMQALKASQRAKRAQERADGVSAAQRYTHNPSLLRDCGEVGQRCCRAYVPTRVTACGMR